jgi:hypothetical protein
MKIQEVILRALARKITWYQAAEILGISDRHMRRYDGLFDRRRGQPSPRCVPLALVEQVLGLYRGAGAGTKRAQLRHLAGTVAAGVTPGGNQHAGRGECISAGGLRGRVQPTVSSARRTTRQRVCGAPQPGSGSDLRPAVRAHGESRQYGQHSESQLADRSGALASQPGGLQRDRAPALGRDLQPRPTDRTGWAATTHKARLWRKIKRGADGLWKRRGVEKSKNRLSHPAWKSRKTRGIPTFPQPRLRLVL